MTPIDAVPKIIAKASPRRALNAIDGLEERFLLPGLPHEEPHFVGQVNAAIKEACLHLLEMPNS